ncbi:hypothetical protein B0H16DRAFT_840357 [Mycena metata]|uniref:Uncharacterized protein n=1 Tax=Mycena metata TaxID=1033252 RepID=A0AAD7N9A8_9AGAR|nr:hypothetical protein B0H16DRAFT_840357 [Mycena metata]
MDSESTAPHFTVNEDNQLVWATRTLISAPGSVNYGFSSISLTYTLRNLAIYFYDFLQTWMNEIELYQHSARDRKLLWAFMPLRYLPALYQLLMIFSLIDMTPSNITSCAALDKAALGLDTSFQLAYIGIITWRVKVINGIWLAIPLGLLGLSSPILNIAVSNPSVFPQCRLLSTAPTARIITVLPCPRAAFDAATTLALLAKIWRHVASSVAGVGFRTDSEPEPNPNRTSVEVRGSGNVRFSGTCSDMCEPVRTRSF